MSTNFSVIDPPFLVGLGIATAVVFVASWIPVRRSWVKWSIRGVGVVLAIVLAAAGLNARYAYLPTVATLFGRTATDAVSPSQLRKLELAGAGMGDMAQPPGVGLAIARSTADSALDHGVVVPFAIPATSSHFHPRTAEVYLPPAYFRRHHPQLPVIELLHGTPGSPVDWTRGAYADVAADEYASQHHGFAPILVMPDVNGSWTSDSECVNGKGGAVQTYLAVDVRNAVIARFHTRPDAGGWAIAGYSEGAYCSLQIGLRHPDQYHAIGDFSGKEGPTAPGGPRSLFAGTWARAEHEARRYDPAVLLKDWHGSVRPAIWFEVGTHDVTLAAMAKLDELARMDGFDTRFVAQPQSSHSFASWRASFRDALPWLVASSSASVGTTRGA